MAVGASRCAGCDRRAVFFDHRHVSHQAPGYGLAAGNFTLDHCKELLQTPKALASIWKSLFLAVSSASICSVIGTAVVVAVRKSRGFFKKALEGISLLPEMLPSIVLVILSLIHI